MNRRGLLASLPALTLVRGLMAQAGVSSPRLGICAFSCHQHWKALDALNDEHRQDPKEVSIGVKFRDTCGFYRYARDLGAEGVQAPLRGGDPIVIRQIVEETGGYYEGDLRLPKTPSDMGAVESEIRSLREAGAQVARAVFTAGRRYEVFRTMADFRIFQDQARRSLELIEPILQKYQLRLAIENHKDHTTEELIGLMEHIGSEWVGVLVDTGNNIALLEEAHAVVEALAPYALSVHLKDMVVQESVEGFLLSEVPLGTGMTDLRRVIATLTKHNPAIVLNLEMATRNPLIIPCASDPYYATFPDRRTSHLAAAMERVRQNPPRGPVPSVSGKSTVEVLAEEERNNRNGLAWMTNHPSA
jgi:3-oxoisoapionate decarboxylase